MEFDNVWEMGSELTSEQLQKFEDHRLTFAKVIQKEPVVRIL